MAAPVPPRILTDRDPGDETPSKVQALDVVSWRFECLEDAGYPTAVAVRLAEHADVDLHDAVELLRRGCPVTRAVEILL